VGVIAVYLCQAHMSVLLPSKEAEFDAGQC